MSISRAKRGKRVGKNPTLSFLHLISGWRTDTLVVTSRKFSSPNNFILLTLLTINQFEMVKAKHIWPPFREPCVDRRFSGFGRAINKQYLIRVCDHTHTPKCLFANACRSLLSTDCQNLSVLVRKPHARARARCACARESGEI